ncbi:YecA family protein [Sphingopyxis sp. 22461]|uniref:YecA family protein n=1 Tax=Sphingopyxis sp. 22461 TaxID=3453923 RepID=UPI003F841B6C
MTKRKQESRFARHQRRRADEAARREAATKAPPRSEADILIELRETCRTPGFAHLVAHLVVRDDFVIYHEEVTPADMQNLYGFSRLNRPEIATLIGYMIQDGGDALAAPPANPAAVLARAEALLSELQHRLNLPPTGAPSLEAYIEMRETGEAMREPMFYGAESAFTFQYRDLAAEKYRADNDWLETNKRFTIEDACTAVDAIVALQEEQITARLVETNQAGREDWSLLQGFILDRAAIAVRCALPDSSLDAILEAFSTPIGGNADFLSIHDHNRAATAPLIALGDRTYALFQQYALFEALYEGPFFWMFDDKAYCRTAGIHRGDFTETFTERRLADVFGPSRVHRGLRLFKGKGREVGEIDILVEFGGRLVLVQAKSKRLTLKARSGDDEALRTSFERAVQQAYDQALVCAEALVDPAIRVVRKDGSPFVLAAPPTKIYPLCLVSDHYPALVAQTERFLVRRTVAGVAEPIVTDIFALDALAEMLDRPLRFLAYCELRDRFGERLIYSHEMVLLSEHVKRNLWVDDQYTGMLLDDNIGADIEIAMTARRRGVPGATTPKGPLTAFAGTIFDGTLARIESAPEAAMVDLGLLLLEASGSSVQAFNAGATTITQQVRADGRLHDFSLSLGGTGLTVHTSRLDRQTARTRLEVHVEAAKYRERFARWFGVILDPDDGLPVAGLCLDYPWTYDAGAAELARHFPGKARSADVPRALRSKTPRPRTPAGRNVPCRCGSGRKTKHCCGPL